MRRLFIAWIKKKLGIQTPSTMHKYEYDRLKSQKQKARNDMTEDELKRINVDYLRDCIPGACFHGEVWVECLYCGKGHELMGCSSDRKDGYLIIKCECGNYFRDK